MSAVTITVRKVRDSMPKISEFLSSRGAEVLTPTNEWEMLRFKSGASTGIVYRDAKHNITLTGPAKKAIPAFFGNQAWSAGVATKRTKKLPHTQALLQRDGSNCFLCLLPLGDDMTRDHLAAVAHGGPNHIANMALMHGACNRRAGTMSVMQKIAEREKARAAIAKATGAES